MKLDWCQVCARGHHGYPRHFLQRNEEWFGSGGQSFRLILASNRFVELVKGRELDGLLFKPVRLSGHSQRAI
jgi:hypothetical protein